MNNFQWIFQEGVSGVNLNIPELENWLFKVANLHSRIIGELNYIFCNDEQILRVNREFLNHDYFTDIITFDRSKRKMVNGDIYISVETVMSNASKFNQPFIVELNRVIVHGLLHLCGINDKGPGEREIMEMNEDEALMILRNIQCKG